MVVTEVRVDPLGPLFLRPPSPFTVGVFGPGALGSSLSYPMPSTISGLLAFQAYVDGLCGSVMEGSDGMPEYGDQLQCLRELAGDAARLLTGLLWSGGEWYAYHNTDRLPPLREIVKAAARTVKTRCPEKPDGEPVRAVRERRIGIALENRSKSVSRSHIYSMERIAYKPDSTIVSLLVSSSSLSLSATAKLGGKGGIVRVGTRVSSASEEIVQPGHEYAAVLISPALLEKSPFSGPILVTGEKSRRELVERLLEEAGHRGTGEVLIVPKGEWRLEALMPGWSLAGNRPRRPMLVVPPGTVLWLEPGEPLPAVRLGDGMYLVGLGCCSKLGWGTVLMVPL